MSFLAPKMAAPAAPTPPPAPPKMANAQTQDAGAAVRAAAAAANGQGFADTIKTSAQGADSPAVAKKVLLGA